MKPSAASGYVRAFCGEGQSIDAQVPQLTKADRGKISAKWRAEQKPIAHNLRRLLTVLGGLAEFER